MDPAPLFEVEKLPVGASVFAVESDAYFSSLAPEVTFDLAYLDGLHTFEQTKSDLINALRHVPTGAVLIDDTVPSDEIAAMRDIDESYAERRKWRPKTDPGWATCGSSSFISTGIFRSSISVPLWGAAHADIGLASPTR